MWIVAGLGNPGNKYSKNRHNIGFMVIDLLSEKLNIAMDEKDSYMIGRGAFEGAGLVLLKPLTFMNRSGLAVRKVLKKHNAGPDRLIVIHDDLDIATGALKIRKDGSSGGHRGVESIIQETGSRDFIRIRLGIGRDSTVPVEEYVLRNFRPFEKEPIKDVIIKGCDAVLVAIREGADKAMNKFNRSVSTAKKAQA